MFLQGISQLCMNLLKIKEKLILINNINEHYINLLFIDNEDTIL